MLLLVVVSFLAGVLTVASPCVLPVLPMLLSTSAGGGRWRPLGIALGLAGSFTAATLLVVAAAGALAVPVIWLRTLSIMLLGLYGLSLMLPRLGHAFERLLSPLARMPRGSGVQPSGFGGGLVIGSGLGLLWAPCVGPIVGSVIGLTATFGLSWQAGALTFAYALGATLPMLVVAYGTRNVVRKMRRMAPHSAGPRVVLGGLTVLAALAIFFGIDARLQDLTRQGLPPEYSALLQGVEKGAKVDSELRGLDANFSSREGMPAMAVVPTGAPTSPVPTRTPQPVPTSTPQPVLAMPDQGAAPELAGITGWFNTPGNEPLSLEGLRGKVVLIDFWTFGCYNCRNVRPYLRDLYDKYHAEGLEIIGVHTPEFAYERVPENIEKAAAEQHVNWPIALDPDFKTWRAYQNGYWPALYFNDAKGHLRATYIGEGNYDKKELMVQQLLAEAQQGSQ
jgi:cytochrome c biogenesis protein CcdA/thiol-disulfide isomerase/thioredoxin